MSRVKNLAGFRPRERGLRRVRSALVDIGWPVPEQRFVWSDLVELGGRGGERGLACLGELASFALAVGHEQHANQATQMH